MDTGLAVWPSCNTFLGVRLQLAALPMTLIPYVLGDAILKCPASSAAGGIDVRVVAPVHHYSSYGALMRERRGSIERRAVLSHVPKVCNQQQLDMVEIVSNVRLNVMSRSTIVSLHFHFATAHVGRTN